MAADDFDVVVFKVLSYLYQCIKEGVEPNPDKAQEFAKMFWRSVDLTGNQTGLHVGPLAPPFWRSVDLTGNQTARWWAPTRGATSRGRAPRTSATRTASAPSWPTSTRRTQNWTASNQTVGFREALEDALGEDWDELEYINWR